MEAGSTSSGARFVVASVNEVTVLSAFGMVRFQGIIVTFEGSLFVGTKCGIVCGIEGGFERARGDVQGARGGERVFHSYLCNWYRVLVNGMCVSFSGLGLEAGGGYLLSDASIRRLASRYNPARCSRYTTCCKCREIV